MSRGAPFTLRLYGAGARLFGLAAPLFLALRRARGKEHVLRSAERRGHAGLPRPDGPLIWLHGASVGETVTVLPLVRRLIERGHRVLVTSGTVTSAAVVAQRLPEGGLHQFVPLDVPAFVERFLDHWRPDLAIFVESELWPVTIAACRRRRVPLVLVNARMSPRSFARWQKAPHTIAALLGCFDLCLAQSARDAERLAALAAPRISTTGNLKFDVPPPPADAGALADLSHSVGVRRIWVAASTHPGEEAIAAEVHRLLKPDFPDLLTVVAPRHPERGGGIAADMAEAGLAAIQRSHGFLPDRGIDIYIADTMGELGLFYRLADVVLMGGSLVRHGGQNPAEPAKLATAILHGPHVHNFVEAYGALDESGGARVVTAADDLAAELRRLLSDPTAAGRMAQSGAGAIERLGGALERTLTALQPYLVDIALRRD